MPPRLCRTPIFIYNFFSQRLRVNNMITASKARYCFAIYALILATTSNNNSNVSASAAIKVKTKNIAIPEGDYYIKLVEPEHPFEGKFLARDSIINSFARSTWRTVTDAKHYVQGAGVGGAMVVASKLSEDADKLNGFGKFVRSGADKYAAMAAMGGLATFLSMLFGTEFTTTVLSDTPMKWRIRSAVDSVPHALTMNPILKDKRSGFLWKKKSDKVIRQNQKLVARNASMDVFDSQDESDAGDDNTLHPYVIYLAKSGNGREVLKWLRADYMKQVDYDYGVKTAFELIPAESFVFPESKNTTTPETQELSHN